MNKNLARKVVDQMFYEMWNKQNPAIADQIFADNFEVHYSINTLKDINEFKNLLNKWFTAFPDLKYSIDDYIVEDNKIVTRWHGKGTHQGEFVGIPTTGKSFYYAGITILSLLPDGKIAQAWVYNDLADAIAKLKA